MKHLPLFSLIFLLAGCAAPPQTTVPEPLLAEPEPDIFGMVLDENGALLENVQLTIFPQEITIQSSNGTFQFFNVTKDIPLQIEARKEGHRNSTASLRLPEGVAAQVIFPMPSLASLPPQFFVSEFSGFIGCETSPDVPCPTATEDRFATYVDHAAPSDLELMQTVIEVFWNQTLLSDALHLTVHSGEKALFEDNINSGWKMVLDSPDIDHTYTVHAPEGGLTFNQRFEIFTTHFYNRAGPADYTIQDGVDSL